MKLTNPLPQPLPKECEKAAKIFKSFVDSSNNGLDGVIPRHILENAKGFAIFTIVKAGFVFSARAGSGIVIAKLDNGTWSAPSAIGTAGLGVGGQAGAEMTDFLIVLNSRSAIRSFMSAGSLTLGGNMSLALGPLGRNGEASGSLSTNGKVAAMYSYSKTRGLFGGVSVEGSVIVEREDANVQAYESPVTARMLLGGAVDPPPWAMPLIKTLEACTGMPGNREWVDEPRTPGGSYAFGGVGSSESTGSSPSFLRKKKRPETSAFPPASWGAETNSGSYFSPTASQSSQSHSRNMTWDSGDSSVTNSFSTKFESDSIPERRPSPFKRTDFSANGTPSPPPALRTTSNPFVPSHRSSGSSPKLFDMSWKSPPEYKNITPTHQRATSLKYDLRPANEDDDVFYTSDSLNRAASTPAHPIIKQREELSRPLLPGEGVARAIALYDFNAVESGDLSFRKGDVIVVTKKSDSVDDWWTGKANGRQGIFPANFIELA
ncbi:unnamed protein product [Cyclocybe aegerita]|uniref:SH3 domain-containing protein n=1 Tax=Cyclocybe aegerita TaxID=1973307 RepID=A0A8S0W7B7_CYCAE|nr:unnamed protein product [Cyclocybe aegerita]